MLGDRALDRFILFSSRAFLHTSTKFEHIEDCADTQVFGNLFEVEFWRLGPVKVGIVFHSLAIAASSSVGVPAEEEQFRFTVLPTIG